MRQIFCTACGSALAPGAAFCGSCGTAVDAGGGAGAAADASASAPAPAPATEVAASAPEIPAPPPAPEAYAPPPAPPEAYSPPPAAPAYAPPPQPAYAAPPAAAASAPPARLAADPAHEQLVRAYVGPNADHYLAKWRQIAAAGKPNSWNWASFLLNAFWLAYRKMWQPALGTVGAIFALQLLGLFAPSLGLLISGLELGICAWIGWRGNALYLNQAERALAQSATAAPDPNGRIAWLQAQGGVDMPKAVGLAIAVALLWVLLIFVIAQQMGLGRRYGSSYYGSSSYGSSTSSAAPLSEDWITDEYLEGSQWAPNCYGAGAYIRFNPNKTFTSSVGSGSWTQFGGVLTLSYSGGQPSETMTLHKQGPNQFTFTEANRTGTFNRCPT